MSDARRIRLRACSARNRSEATRNAQWTGKSRAPLNQPFRLPLFRLQRNNRNRHSRRRWPHPHRYPRRSRRLMRLWIAHPKRPAHPRISRGAGCNSGAEDPTCSRKQRISRSPFVCSGWRVRRTSVRAQRRHQQTPPHRFNGASYYRDTPVTQTALHKPKRPAIQSPAFKPAAASAA